MRSLSLLSLGLVSMTAVAAAQPGTGSAQPDPATAEAVEGAMPAAATDPNAGAAPNTATMMAPAPVEPAASGPTLRNGFSLSIGQENGSGPSESLSGQLYGLDWRIGMAISDKIAVYASTHLSFGTANIGAASGVTANFATALIGEYTLPMRIFVGGGAGYGVLNNPSGPLAQIRAGWYPFEKTSQGKARRLNVALDARFYFPGEAIGTVSHYALSVGYDRF